jgi:hypothetical protein
MRTGIGLLATLLAAANPVHGATASAAEAMPAPVVDEAESGDLRLGGFLLSGINTRIRLDTPLGAVGSNINFASTLGGETSVNVFRADASWTIKGRHSLDASWFDIDLRGRRRLEANITYGGQNYVLGTDVESRFRTEIYKIGYGYALYRRDQHEITGLLGAHIIQFQTSIKATALGQSEQFSTTAPLPSFGLAWRAKWSDNLTTRLSCQYFGISLDRGKYSGHFTDALAAVEYQITSHGGLGFGYNRFDLEGSTKAGPLKLTANYAYNGLLLYGFFRF